MPTDDAFDVGSVGISARCRLPLIVGSVAKVAPPPFASLRAEISEAEGCVCVLFA